MSTPKSLILNCGTSHVTAALFSEKGDKLVLEEIASRELEYDYSVDEEWLTALKAAVNDLASQHRVKGKATLILPGYLLLTKNIKVPHVDPSRQQQIITFEADQNIPHPLDEVEWDHQVIGDDGVETEVTLIAVKKDTAEEFCHNMAAIGVVPESVEAASILDYSAYRYTYADDDQPTLLINVGARSTNLIFTSESGFFVRNIALGGNSLTQNIADNLGKSFTQAEHIKTAFFTGQSSFASDDSSVQILQSNAESFLKRMSQEITRSIVTYRRQKRGEAPQRILLTGRGSLLPGLPEYLSEQQKISVDYFDPTRRLELGSGIDSTVMKREQYMLTEVLGIGCRGKLGEKVGINLLPTTISKEMAFKRKKPFIVMAAALTAAALVPPILYFEQAATAYADQAANYAAPAAELNTLANRIEDTNAEASDLLATINQFKDLRATKNNWINFLADLMTRLQESEDVWLTNLKVVREEEDQPRRPSGFGRQEATVEEADAKPQQFRLDLAGNLLIRSYDPDNPGGFNASEASAKINKLLDSFTESEFISKVEDIKLDTTNPRLIQFNFTLILDEEKPL